MAVKRAVTHPGTAAGADHDPVIVAEGVSKQYPCERVRLFPPVQMFHSRFKFRRASAADEPAASEDKSRAEADPGASRSGVRVRRRRERERDYDDLDDDDDDDEEDEDDDDLAPGRVGGPTPSDPGEMFWALKDVSLSLPPGAALGVLGGPGAGKSTLLNVLGGRVFPTEGSVLTRGVVSPVPTDLAKALALSGKGYFQFNLVMGCRLVGIHSPLVKKHREEIEELAEPVLGPDGEPAPGAMARLAAATAVTLPASVILFDDGVSGLDEAFLARAAERLRERVRNGTALVYASRSPEAIRELCDETIVLEGGQIVQRGPVEVAAEPYRPAQNGEQEAAPRAEASESPASAALLSVEIQAADGSRSKRIDAGGDLAVSIQLETAQPDTEVHCGVCFTPRSGETGVRVEHPEPLRLREPQAYEVMVRVPAGTLPSGGYRVHANALIATASEPDASAITRDAGRLRIVGEAGSEQGSPAPPVEHWDGCVSRRADAEWSIR